MTKLYPLHYVVLCMQLLCTFAHATVVPAFSLNQLVNDSDVIVVGEISDMHEIGNTTVLVSGALVRARKMAGVVDVQEVLKGAVRTSRLDIQFAITEKWVGYPSIPSGTRILFLNLAGETSVPANLYYPSLPAVAGTKSTGGTVLDRVVSELVAVLGSASAPVDQKSETIARLEGIATPSVLSALKNAATQNNDTVRLNAVTALLERDEISVLPIAERALLNPDRQLPDYLRHNLSYGIFTGVKSERAIPALSRLLASPETEVRRAAIMALRRSGSHQALNPLTKGLYDSDLQVRYLSVLGLAEITGETNWETSQEEFSADELRYLRYWRQWATDSQTRHR